MSGRRSLRIWLSLDRSGLVSARLIPRGSTFRAFVAAAEREEGALAELELGLSRALEEDGDVLEPFWWTEELRTGQVVVEVRPQTLAGKRPVIGKERIPITFGYAWAELAGDGAGYFVSVPRFGWSFVLEDLGMAAEVLRQTLSADLAGESARSVFEFREVKDERVLEWAPKRLGGKGPPKDPLAGYFDTLRAVAEDWTALARAGKLGAHFGSVASASLDALLGRGTKPSLLLIGPAGVGKTAWVKELARRMPRSGDALSETRVWSTSADRIMAGMQYLGMWEQRCLDLIAELAGEGHFLHVDHLVGLTRVRSNASSIADLFAPALESGEIALVAECSESELGELSATAPRLLSCFQLVHLAPPTPEWMARTIHERATRTGSPWRFGDEATRRLLRHLTLFRRDHAFPGKAFAFLDWLDRERPSAPRELTLRDTDRQFCRWSGLPERIVSDDERGDPEALADVLRERVVGQDAACAAAARVLSRFKAGIQDPDKPMGSLLFVGPTGVGKTELAKELARFMFGSPTRMVRLDMSEYLLAHSVTRLLSDQRGTDSLAQRISREPLSLVLLDEIEKAHPAVFDVLLGALGEGRLTTESGRLVDLSMTLIVMTSNLGADAVHLGFGAKEADAEDARAAVRAHFRPELINRLDEIVAFQALSPQALRRIVSLELGAAAAREGLVRRNLTLSVAPEVEAHLAELGYDPKYGARPLKRVIEEQVITPIAVEIARRPKLANARLRLELRGGAIQLQIG
ncbi:MAG: ATP-dependent Clp protease ATP-binding subunit [Polyangiaceae bacterium]|nr:ATP-dependent Clp protease ATP-binding subunit [Polyangiaceae bacterium]MCL4752107.1 AAA family ATPase [Myxococcales bacterium]